MTDTNTNTNNSETIVHRHDFRSHLEILEAEGLSEMITVRRFSKWVSWRETRTGEVIFRFVECCRLFKAEVLSVEDHPDRRYLGGF